MENNELTISLSTLINLDSFMGLKFYDNSRICHAQEEIVYKKVQDNTTITLKDSNYGKQFVFGCLDFLITNEDNALKYNFIEFNGTSVGGLTRMPLDILDVILSELASMCRYTNDSLPVLIIPYWVKHTEWGAPIYKAFHERILKADYLKKGLIKYYGDGEIVSLSKILRDKTFIPTKPCVVFGHINDFINIFSVKSGRLCIYDYPVSLSILDYACSKIFRLYKDQVSQDSFLSVNSFCDFSADKGIQYTFYNEFLENSVYKTNSNKINFQVAYTREELINIVVESVNLNKRVIIKPYATGTGTGIEFFVTKESEDEIVAKIDNSISQVKAFQGKDVWMFPYTISEFIDAVTINKSEHPKFGHKFELRIFVYKDKNELKAFPCYAKVAPKTYNPDSPDQMMLLNTVSKSSTMNIGTVDDFAVPLSNLKSLDALGLSLDNLTDICSIATNFTNFVIEKTYK